MKIQKFKSGCTKILHNGTIITVKNNIVEAFNNYLTSGAVNVSSEIPHTGIDFKDSLQDHNFADTFFLRPLTPSKIREINLGLK